MLKLLNHSETPPGMFTYTVEQTRAKFRAFTLRELQEQVIRHYTGNNIPQPENLYAIIEDDVCKRLPIGWSADETSHIYRGVACRVTADMVLNGLKSLLEIVKNYFVGKDIFSPPIEAEERAKICSTCAWNMPISSCQNCKLMTNAINTLAKIRGERKTQVDDRLANCCLCGCHNKTIVHIKKELLLAGQDEKDMLKYPSWCWKITKP